MTVDQLKAQLVHLRMAALSIAAHVDSLLAMLPQPQAATDPGPGESFNCAEGRHPTNALKPAPVMGRPNKKVCLECRQTVDVKENEQ